MGPARHHHLARATTKGERISVRHCPSPSIPQTLACDSYADLHVYIVPSIAPCELSSNLAAFIRDANYELLQEFIKTTPLKQQMIHALYFPEPKKETKLRWLWYDSGDAQAQCKPAFKPYEDELEITLELEPSSTPTTIPCQQCPIF